MGVLDGRVAFVTGMGRNHAVRLAREGASIIGVDVAAKFHHTTVTPRQRGGPQGNRSSGATRLGGVALHA
jgi:NAD(P)-dependent dehydrogenase (short-subunit alcohol dehydrogenase family)